MDSCQHIANIKIKKNVAILNPQKWNCYVCGTTESVWACLSCSNVACGRFNQEHALKHFKDSKHPLCIEVNSKYVYCYACDDYVMNDNASGDISTIRNALSAIATQSFSAVESHSRQLLRSYSQTAVSTSYASKEDDKMATAVWHRRQKLLGKVLEAWKLFVLEEKSRRTPKKKQTSSEKQLSPSPSSLFPRKRTIIPGITGLKNLGNTCYMNSILQVLSHIEMFRDYFINHIGVEIPNTPVHSPSTSPFLKSPTPCQTSTPVPHPSPQSNNNSLNSSTSMYYTPPSSPSQETRLTSSGKKFKRQTTVDCFQHLMTPVLQASSSKKQKLGLHGGSSSKISPIRRQLICNVESKKLSLSTIALCQELNGLFRVLWSGRWAQVSPHAFLQAVWQVIPMFKGHAQHDAQEFLCELLDKVQRELATVNGPLSHDVTTDTFQGEIVSQVTCLKCGNISERHEPYLDLSLEFPPRYQITKKNSRIADDICHITEMLAHFTDTEKLEGQIYICEKCNKNNRRRSAIYTAAQKRILIYKLPNILRLHLKRFRWSGRLHREKIGTHVAFDDCLDLQPFCNPSLGAHAIGYQYRLLGVVIHHGQGFGSGHYTAKCWNREANSWVNCNDARVTMCELEDVLQSQAYILIYQHLSSDLNNSSSSSSSDAHFSAQAFQMHSDTQKLSPNLTGSPTIECPSKPTPLRKRVSSITVDDNISFNFFTSVESPSCKKQLNTTDTKDNVASRLTKRRRSSVS